MSKYKNNKERSNVFEPVSTQIMERVNYKAIKREMCQRDRFRIIPLRFSLNECAHINIFTLPWIF